MDDICCDRLECDVTGIMARIGRIIPKLLLQMDGEGVQILEVEGPLEHICVLILVKILPNLGSWITCYKTFEKLSCKCPRQICT